MTEERTEYTVSIELKERLDALWGSYGVLATQVRDYWDSIMEAAETIKELKAQVQRLEQDKRRMIAQIPYEDLRYIVNSHPNLRVDLRIEAKRWLDTVKVPHD